MIVKSKRKNMLLTSENYFGPDNKCLTNSRVRDYQLSKKYYYDRWIVRTVKDDPTASLLLGSAVDAIFSGGTGRFAGRFTTKTLAKENDERTILTPAVYGKALAMGETILKTEAYRDLLPGGIFQQPFHGFIPRSRIEFAGMPDCVVLTDRFIYIIDLKTTRNSALATPNAWYWTCLKSGYFRQFAVYRELLRRYYGRKRRIICRHMVVGSTEIAGGFPVKLFTVPDKLLKPAWREFVTLAKEISRCQDFTDPPVTWQSAVKLKAPDSWEKVASFDEMDE